MISRNRAIEIKELMKWKSLKCAEKGATRPNIEESSTEEVEYIIKTWNSMPGNPSIYTAILEIIKRCDQKCGLCKPEREKRGKNDIA